MKKSARGFQMIELLKTINGSNNGHQMQQASTSSVLHSYSYTYTSSDEDFDSDDSVQDKTYLPPNPIQHNDHDSDSDILNSQPVVLPKSPTQNHNLSSFGQNDSDFVSIIPNSQNIMIPESPTQEQDHLTKKRTVRKRKTYETSIAERTKTRKEEKISKDYALKPGCDETCKRKCSSMIHEDRRKSINELFWSLTWSEQRVFISSHTSTVEPVRKKKFAADSNQKNRRNLCPIFLATK